MDHIVQAIFSLLSDNEVVQSLREPKWLILIVEKY